MVGFETAEKPADSKFALYLVCFAVAWSAYVVLVYPRIAALGVDTFGYAAASIVVRLLLWVAPVFIYLRRVDRVEPVRYLRLAEGWKRGVLVGMGLFAVVLVGSAIRFGWPSPNWKFVTWNSVLGTSFGVGFFEEIPFRGFILQKFAGRMNFWLANLLTSLLFVGVHLPGWVSLHLFQATLAMNVFVISFLLGAIFWYSRSLWSCIVGHSANDFVSFVLFQR
jgi:uncharacterized protein